MNVQPLLGSTGHLARDRTSVALSHPRRYLVTELAIGEDATTHPALPDVGSELTIGSYKVTCDRVEVEEYHSDNAVTVAAYYSNDGRFRFPEFPSNPSDPDNRSWDIGYKKSTIDVPQFFRGERTYKDSTGATVTAPYWIRSDWKLDIEMQVFNTRLILDGISQSSIRAIVQTVNGQLGKLHRFDNRWWQFQPPTIRSNKPDVVEIFYSWVHDPGNGHISKPNGYADNEVVLAGQRLPFWVYNVAPQTEARPVPQIYTQDLFPEDSPYLEPNGWQNLPGNPI